MSLAYTNWEDDMSSLSQLKIPRKVLPTHLYDEATLEVFCDASEKAYGACVYLVSVKDDIVSSTLISSKCKVDPIKPQLSLDSSSWQFTLVTNLQQHSRGYYQNQRHIEYLCAVHRLNNLPLVDQDRPCSMAYVCVKPRVKNSVNAPNN